jgi:hypothetical protein
MTERQTDFLMALIEGVGVLVAFFMVIYASLTGQAVIAVVLLFVMLGLVGQMALHLTRVL